MNLYPSNQDIVEFYTLEPCLLYHVDIQMREYLGVSDVLDIIQMQMFQTSTNLGLRRRTLFYLDGIFHVDGDQNAIAYSKCDLKRDFKGSMDIYLSINRTVLNVSPLVTSGLKGSFNLVCCQIYHPSLSHSELFL